MAEWNSLLIKLASLARHAEELLSPTGNVVFDGAAIWGILADPEVVEAMKEAEALALLPVSRSDADLGKGDG